MIIFSFRNTVHRCIVRVTQSNWVKMWFSCFSVLPGNAEAQVISGGIVKRLLIAYFIRNISAKNYQNPFMFLKVIANQRWDVFWDIAYIHFWGLLLHHGILPGAKFTLRQILRSPILAVSLHGTRAVGGSQALRRSADGATYIRQGGHHVGHRPTF